MPFYREKVMSEPDFLSAKPAPLSVLLLADKAFMRRCENPDDYISRLKNYLISTKGTDVCLYSPAASYNLIFEGIIPLELECQNKTSFVFSLENTINLYDECYIISNSDYHDPFLEGAREIMTTHNKSITGLGYKKRE